jgi:hypothetical protein
MANRLNGFLKRSNFDKSEKPLKRLEFEGGQLDHRAEATVRMRGRLLKNVISGGALGAPCWSPAIHRLPPFPTCSFCRESRYSPPGTFPGLFFF